MNYGDPLILGLRQKESSHNKVHKKGQAGYSDATVIWDHHDSGTITDVVMGKKGPTVVVKASSPMQTETNYQAVTETRALLQTSSQTEKCRMMVMVSPSKSYSIHSV